MSPKVLSDGATNNSQPEPAPKTRDMSERSTKLIDDHQFVENLSDYLSDNPDFVVVGVIGPQGSGKSTILNHLARALSDSKNAKSNDGSTTTNGVGQSEVSDFFRVQSFEKQMTGEHCTNGLSVWISPKHRIILIDSQPINSPSVLDRTIKVRKSISVSLIVFSITFRTLHLSL